MWPSKRMLFNLPAKKGKSLYLYLKIKGKPKANSNGFPFISSID
jgi:hypothetical protein